MTMTIYDLKTAGRQYRRQFGTAIRGNLIRALTELITNSDDSYRRLEQTGHEVSGRIVINYNRGTRTIAVIDDGEGLTDDEMASKFVEYGAATSGLLEDRMVRGYFGKGIKDVLFAMEKGNVKSIKDGKLYSSKFRWSNDQKPQITIHRPQRATLAQRRSLGIPESGTRVEFMIPDEETLSRHETLANSLSSFYMLRTINSSNNRQVLLQTTNANGSEYESVIEYIPPVAEELLTTTFAVPFRDNSLKVELEVFRAKSPLTQSGDDREGGLLVTDEFGSVLDLTLFRFDADENASRLFGYLRVYEFKTLLADEELVLSDSRDGLSLYHPFVRALKQEVESRLTPLVDAERDREAQSTRGISRRQRQQLDRSISRINELLERLTSQVWSTGGAVGEQRERPEGGIQFRPESVRVYEGTETRVRLMVDTSVIEPGTHIELGSSNDDITVEPEEFDLVSESDGVVTETVIVVLGRTPGQFGSVQASAKGRVARLDVEVIPDAYPQPNGGFAFIPEIVRIPNNTTRHAHLYIDETAAVPGDVITLAVDRDEIQLSKMRIVLDPQNYRGGIARVSVPLRGSGIGAEGVLSAYVNSRSADATVAVVSLRERRRGSSGLISDYNFDDRVSRNRATYDEETGIIWVHRRHPIVSRYFGDLDIGTALSLPHCQVMLAEIVLESVAVLARKKMIESKAAMYLGDNRTEEDLIAIERFKYDYGDTIHSWLVDESNLARVADTA